MIADSTLEINIHILENRVEFGINSTDYLSEYDDLIAKVKKKFDDYAATVQDSIDKAQALHDQIVEYTNLINSKGVILRSEFGDISSIKQPLGQTVVDKLNNEFNDRGVNVKWFGAKGDGITDDTDPVSNAIEYVRSNKLDKVYFPDGDFVVNPETSFKISGMSVIGKSRNATKIHTKSTVFYLGSFSNISDICFVNDSQTDAPIIYLGGMDIPSVFTININKLRFIGYKDPNQDYQSIPIKFELNNCGIWDVNISNLIIENVYSGVQIDVTNGGWMTSCNFKESVTKKFSHSAFEIISSNSTLQEGVVTMSSFNWTAEVVGNTLDAVGFIIAGSNNQFNDLRLFQDGKYTGKAIQLTNQSDKALSNVKFGQGYTAYNTFNGGHLEGSIDDQFGLYDLQYWNDVMVIGYYRKNDDGTDDMSSGHPVMMQTTRRINLLSEQTIGEIFDKDKLRINTIGSVYTSGTDTHGQYIQVDATDATTISSAYIYLPNQVGLAKALTNNRFTLALKVKDLNRTIDNIVTSPVIATLVFNGSSLPRKDMLETQFANENIPSDKDYKELIWCFNENPNWFNSIVNYREAFVNIRINPGSKVRIYYAAVVTGFVNDMSLIEPNNRFNLPIYGGGRNYLNNSNISIEETNVSNIVAKGKSCSLDVAALNLQKSKYVTISADVDVSNWDPHTNKSRLGVYAEVILTFDDGTNMGLNCGVPNIKQSLIRGRVSAFFYLPEKRIESATAIVGVTGGGSADYYYVGYPQVETGTKMTDWHPAKGDA